MKHYRIECPECNEDTLIVITEKDEVPYGESYTLREVISEHYCENDCDIEDAEFHLTSYDLDEDY